MQRVILYKHRNQEGKSAAADGALIILYIYNYLIKDAVKADSYFTPIL